MTQVEELTAPYRLEYPYKRGLGPVLGAFLVASKRAVCWAFAAPMEPYLARLQSITLRPRGDDGAGTAQRQGTLEAVYWIDEPKAHHPFGPSPLRLFARRCGQLFCPRSRYLRRSAAAAPGLRGAELADGATRGDQRHPVFVPSISGESPSQSL